MPYITKTVYKHMLASYADKASWAIWDGKVCNIVPIAKAVLLGKVLHNSVVMVGLNLSRNITGNPPWQNFHDCRARTKDPRLAREIHACHPYWGGYMTDLLHDIVNPSGVKIVAEIKAGTIDMRKPLLAFVQEMTDLGVLPCKKGARHEFVVFGKEAQWVFEVFLLQTQHLKTPHPLVASAITSMKPHTDCFNSFIYTPMPHYSYRTPVQKKAYEKGMRKASGISRSECEKLNMRK